MSADIAKQFLSSGAEPAVAVLKSASSWVVSQAQQHPVGAANLFLTAATFPYGGPVKVVLGLVGFGPLGPVAGTYQVLVCFLFSESHSPSLSLFLVDLASNIFYR